MEYQYLRHPKSGETWAVSVGDDGMVLASIGPLPWREVEAHSPEDFAANMTDEDNGWINDWDTD